MPDTITRIDDWAFSGNSITKLELGQGLVSIGGTNTFASNNIKVLVFPDSLKTIEIVPITDINAFNELQQNFVVAS